MITIKNSELDQLVRRLNVCQSVVWQVCNSLEEYGDPRNAAAIVHSFEDLRNEIERHSTDEAYEPA